MEINLNVIRLGSWFHGTFLSRASNLLIKVDRASHAYSECLSQRLLYSHDIVIDKFPPVALGGVLISGSISMCTRLEILHSWICRPSD